MTLIQITNDIMAQLDWRGPNEKTQGHIVLPRQEAKELLGHISVLYGALGLIADPLKASNIIGATREADMARSLQLIMTLRDIAKSARTQVNQETLGPLGPGVLAAPSPTPSPTPSPPSASSPGPRDPA